MVILISFYLLPGGTNGLLDRLLGKAKCGVLVMPVKLVVNVTGIRLVRLFRFSA